MALGMDLSPVISRARVIALPAVRRLSETSTHHFTRSITTDTKTLTSMPSLSQKSLWFVFGTYLIQVFVGEFLLSALSKNRRSLNRSFAWPAGIS